MDLTGKTVLITGAVGRIGSATARMALAFGSDLVLADLATDKLHFLADELMGSSTQQVYALSCDVTSSSGLDDLFLFDIIVAKNNFRGSLCISNFCWMGRKI